jgi:superfamily II RNA helicase
LTNLGTKPALLFNFDRNDCEQMLIGICESLATAEKRWRDTSPEWKRKVELWEKWKAGARERQRRAERLKAMKKTADDEPGPVEDQTWESSFDPNEPLPQFCFIGSHAAFSRSDLEEEIDHLRWRSVPAWALEGLTRGIAVHHAGMNRAYRSLVER